MTNELIISGQAPPRLLITGADPIEHVTSSVGRSMRILATPIPLLFLLLETGDNILLETGDFIVLEQAA